MNVRVSQEYPQNVLPASNCMQPGYSRAAGRWSSLNRARRPAEPLAQDSVPFAKVFDYPQP
jgi:hypothetical protein